MSHPDRLEGLGRLAEHIIAASTADEVVDRLSRRRIGPDELAWVLWSGHSAPVRQRAAALGLDIVAAYATLPDSLSPTHLVRTDQAVGRRWFADCVRPTWGWRSRLARTVGRYPLAAPHTFRGRALLLAGSRRTVDGWPLSEPGRLPAVITLGGGPTAGRCLLTFANATSIVQHVKIDPASRPTRLTIESRALRALAGLGAVASSVPKVLASGHGDGWVALAQSHAAGASLEHRWSTRASRPLHESDLQRVLTWNADLVEAQLAQSRFISRLDLPGPVHASTSSLTGFPDALVQRIASGLRLAATARQCLVHGDLWPANVLLDGAALSVVDWESARIDHPLSDALTFLVTATQAAHGQASLAEAAITALANIDSRRNPTIAPVRRLIHTTTGDLDRNEVADLLLAQLFLIMESPAPGHGTDPSRRRNWAEALAAVGSGWEPIRS